MFPNFLKSYVLSNETNPWRWTFKLKIITILRLLHFLFLVELLLFSARAFSILHFFCSLTSHIKTYPSSVETLIKPWKSCNNRLIEIKLSSYSNTSNGNDFIVLFKIRLPRFIKRLFLRSNSNLLDSAAKLSKLSKIIAQLHCKRWSDIAGCLTFFKSFPVRIEAPMCSATLL